MKVIYIAGPYRAAVPWLVEQNIRHAERAALDVVALCGGVPLCPHTMYRFFNGSGPDQFWLGGTKELLRRCDAILMVGDWDDSEGSLGERKLAVSLDMPVFYTLAEVADWVREQAE